MRFMKNIELDGENKSYIDNPIFVGGIRRSGTTLIRSRICSQKIIGGPETFGSKLITCENLAEIKLV